MGECEKGRIGGREGGKGEGEIGRREGELEVGGREGGLQAECESASHAARGLCVAVGPWRGHYVKNTVSGHSVPGRGRNGSGPVLFPF